MLPPQLGSFTRVIGRGRWRSSPSIPTARRRVAQLTHWHEGCSDTQDYRFPFGILDLVPAPNGRYLLVRCGTALWLMRGDGTGARQIVPPRGPYPARSGVVATPLWSVNSKRYAYRAEDGYHLRGVAGTGDQLVSSLPPAVPGRRGRRPRRRLRRQTRRWSSVATARVSCRSPSRRPPLSFRGLSCSSPSGDACTCTTCIAPNCCTPGRFPTYPPARCACGGRVYPIN